MDTNLSFLQDVLGGNIIASYLLMLLLIFLTLIFRHGLSILLSKLCVIIFEKFSGMSLSANLIGLLIKPIEMMVVISGFYIALNQLDYPLNEQVFNRNTIIIQQDKTMAVTGSKLQEVITETAEPIFQSINKSLTYGDVLDNIYKLLALVAFFWVQLRIIDFVASIFLDKATAADSKASIQFIPFARESVKMLLITLGVFIIMGEIFRINIGLIISGLGIGGLALALAGKETIENLFGAFTIFIDRPFVVGQRVITNNIDGHVEKVGFRSTRIRTMERSIVSVPNKKIVDSPLDNLDLKTHRRIMFQLGLSYDSNPEQIKAAVKDIEQYFINHEFICEDSIVGFDGFGEYSVNINIIYFVKMIPFKEHVKIKEEVTFAIWNIVNSHKLVIAYPTRRILHETIDTADLNNDIYTS